MRSRGELQRYGLLGMPLAFLALPLYVHLPNLYAREFGVPLATLGALLLGVRLLDALVDPLLGGFCDRLFARSARTAQRWGAAGAAVMALGFGALWLPPRLPDAALVWWAGAALGITYLAFSLVAVLHQAWGAMLGGDDVQQSRVVGWRESLALAGVLLAAVLPLVASRLAIVGVLAALLVAGCWAWWSGPEPVRTMARPQARDFRLPLHDAGFRRLLFVFVLNGIASAVPATLVLFFVQDRLRAPPAMEPAFLGVYFLAAAASVPVWLRAVAHWGLARSWLAGMLLAVCGFAGAASLGAGDAAIFLAICALSGLALGADLALPGALLARTIDAAGQRGRAEGAYFGWWNFASKLNLAAAAGLSLPLLALAGYQPGGRTEGALAALAFAYCVLPCALKCAAAIALHALFIRPARTLPCQPDAD